LQTHTIAHLGLWQLQVFADVNQQATLLDDFLDDEFLIHLCFDFITDPETDALQRSLFGGVGSGFASRSKFYLHAAGGRLHDRAIPGLSPHP